MLPELLLAGSLLLAPRVDVDLTSNALHARVGEQTIESRIVTGKPGWRTPTGSYTIDRLEINKPWWIPPTIQQEMEQRLRGYRRIGERAYQPAGPHNEMGQLSLPFAQAPLYSLHDTPHVTNFWRKPQDRYLSHGCVRVDKIRELVGLLLQTPHEPTLSPQELDALLETQPYQHVTVRFAEPIDVEITEKEE